MKNFFARLFLLTYLFLLGMPTLAIAQDASGQGLGEIAAAAKRSDDKSRQALVAVFGQVVNDPLSAGSAGGGDTILASIFQKTNMALLVIGGVICGYGVARRVISTAHSGTVFDQAANSIWMPLKMVWGVSSLVPTANGWSLAQLTMLWAASVMGVGTANLSVDAAASAMQQGTPLVMQPVMPQTLAVARQLFEDDLCMHAINYGLKMTENTGGMVADSEYVNQSPTNNAAGQANGFVLMDGARTYSCGGAQVDASHMTSEYQSSDWTNYAQFDVSAVYIAHGNALNNMQQTLVNSAKEFVDAVMQVKLGNQVAVPSAEVAIQSAAAAYENTVQAQAATKAGDMNQLSAQLVQNLGKQGWWMLGSWYQTFAMANSRLSDAVSAMANVQAPSPLGASGPAETWQTVLSAYRTQSANSSDATTIGQPRPPGQAASAAGSSSSLFRAVFSDAGQSLIKAMTTSGNTERGQMNPLVRMKNMGDYLMGMAETSLGVVIGLQVVNELKNGWSVAGIAAKIGNLATGIGDGYTGIFKAIYPYLFLMILSLFVFGVTLSIYLPMVPFVVWFGAVINWLVVVAEGIVAAPLWAIAHLGVDGEGLGQRSMHGYLFLLNMCIRPFLMVIGFFVGGGLLQVGGTFLTDGFSVAVANSQFDSVTGIFSVLGYYWLFIQLCLTLVHNCFNLIVLLPDQVIAWVGGYAAGQLGYNAEKISHGFDSGKDKAGHTHERGADQSQRQAGRALPGGNGMSG